MDPSWLKVASQFGIPVALLAVVIYVFIKLVDKKAWPFVEKQFEDSKAERRQLIEDAKVERAQYLATIQAGHTLIAELAEKHGDALRLITAELRTLNAKIDNGNHKTSRR